MTTNVLKRNEILCCQLAMDFNEANELFGDETLSSMQMVHVNGGWINTVGRAIATATQLIAAGITIYHALCGSSVAPNTTFEVTFDGQGGGSIKGLENIKTDSMYYKSGNGTTELKVWGLGN